MQVIERILHMLRVKDCRHVCLFCEYYDMGISNGTLYFEEITKEASE